MDSQALYYTLSTIAQTLAGALAILVAVVVFRLAVFERQIETATIALRSVSLDPTKYWPILRDQGYDALAASASKEVNIANDMQMRRRCEPAVAAYRSWGRINRRLYTALGFTVADIALCLFLLPLTPALKCHRLTAVFALALAVVFAVICLLLYIWLIGAMVRRPTG